MSSVRENLFQIAIMSKNCVVFEATCKRDIYHLFIIRKMIRRYIDKNVINERLLLNNVIISINVFELDTVLKLFDILLDVEEFRILYTILSFIGVCEIQDDNISTELYSLLQSSIHNIRNTDWVNQVNP